MHSKLFEAAWGISDPWFVNGIDFDAAAKRLMVNIDFVAGGACQGSCRLSCFMRPAFPVPDSAALRPADSSFLSLLTSGMNSAALLPHTLIYAAPAVSHLHLCGVHLALHSGSRCACIYRCTS
ncbi:MAG: hypothetical protein VB142_10605 [Burkholderia sp.]